MWWPTVVLGALLVLLALTRFFAADVYDVTIVHMTKTWYAAVLSRLQPGQRVLDIGIGTGTALAENKAALLAGKLRFVGVDYERAYVDKARAVRCCWGAWGESHKSFASLSAAVGRPLPACDGQRAGRR